MSDDLNSRIAEAQARLDARERPSGRMKMAKGASLGLRMATDFSAAILVGAGLGWGADTAFNTSPWGVVVGLLLGFAAGVRNAVAQVMSSNAQAAADSKTAAAAGEVDSRT